MDSPVRTKNIKKNLLYSHTFYENNNNFFLWYLHEAISSVLMICVCCMVEK